MLAQNFYIVRDLSLNALRGLSQYLKKNKKTQEKVTKTFVEGIEVKPNHPIIEKIGGVFKSLKKKINSAFEVDPDKGFFENKRGGGWSEDARKSYDDYMKKRGGK